MYVGGNENLPQGLAERFQVETLLAAGGTGILYQATERTSGRRGVLKLLHGEGAFGVAEHKRLARELPKQSSVESAYLCLPWDSGETDDVLWLFRPWVEGRSLREQLAKGTLDLEESLTVAAQIAAGLEELHRGGLLCRDLKPEHIILRGSDAVIIDAGIAARVPGTDDVYGTPAYMAPEQTEGSLLSFRSDLYAFGCLLYEMVEGQTPYNGEGLEQLEAHRNNKVPPAPQVYPEGLLVLWHQLMAKKPQDRPFSAQLVRRSLDPFVPAPLRTAPGTLRSPSMPPAKESLQNLSVQQDRTQKLQALDLEEVDLKKLSRRSPASRSAPPPAKSADVTQPLSTMDILDAKPLFPRNKKAQEVTVPQGQSVPQASPDAPASSRWPWALGVVIAAAAAAWWLLA